MQGSPSSISVPNLKRIAQVVQKLLRGPEIRKLGHVTPATSPHGSFMVPTQAGSVLYVCTKFEAGSSFCPKVIRGPKYRPATDPLPGGAGPPKHNQLVNTFIYKPSLVKIDERNFELSQ